MAADAGNGYSQRCERTSPGRHLAPHQARRRCLAGWHWRGARGRESHHDGDTDWVVARVRCRRTERVHLLELASACRLPSRRAHGLAVRHGRFGCAIGTRVPRHAIRPCSLPCGEISGARVAQVVHTRSRRLQCSNAKLCTRLCFSFQEWIPQARCGIGDR